MRRLLRHPFVKRHFTLAAIIRALSQPLFLTGLAVLVALWGFAELAEAVNEKGTQKFDEAVLSALREPDRTDELIGPAWFEQSLRDITALGGETVLAMLTIVVCFYLTLNGRHGLSLFTAISVVTGTIVAFALKDFFDRPRPQLVPHILVTVTSGSFPSGHAMGSAIVYLTLGAMLTETAQNWRLKAYVMGVAVCLTLLIGSTRVFLGVHYPTDVLAGWALGFAWAYGTRTAIRLVHYLWSIRRIRRDPSLSGEPRDRSTTN